ncbi:NRDE family protein [Crenobacter cavernae]|uniref:NRDE family protein n=1 Tax=Crenobacter cavernae TaxID=2290923 RepID=A0ABY0FE08_9NEIS|nr:NRDE family protein [Crenobacter cavernae]RXZ44468.1 NRDE family protein [Crenobacter cavernae]
MCVIALAYKSPALGPLFLVANRDERYARPTAPLGYWPDAPHILGGRDLEAGGSWLAIGNTGRFAAVTNIRNGRAQPGRLSRGSLVRDFVTGIATVREFAAELSARRADYAPFNLLYGDVSDLFHYHSVTGTLARLTPGIHTLSNATLDTRWPKTESLAEHLAASPRRPSAAEAFSWLADKTEAPTERLPNTGVGLALEKMLSPVFIHGRDYGTRASMVISANARGDVDFAERSFGPSGRETGLVSYTLRLAPRRNA